MALIFIVAGVIGLVVTLLALMSGPYRRLTARYLQAQAASDSDRQDRDQAGIGSLTGADAGAQWAAASRSSLVAISSSMSRSRSRSESLRPAFGLDALAREAHGLRLRDAEAVDDADRLDLAVLDLVADGAGRPAEDPGEPPGSRDGRSRSTLDAGGLPLRRPRPRPRRRARSVRLTWLASTSVGSPSRSFQRVWSSTSSVSPRSRRATLQPDPLRSTDSTVDSFVGSGRSASTSPRLRRSSGLMNAVAASTSPASSASQNAVARSRTVSISIAVSSGRWRPVQQAAGHDRDATRARDSVAGTRERAIRDNPRMSTPHDRRPLPTLEGVASRAAAGSHRRRGSDGRRCSRRPTSPAGGRHPSRTRSRRSSTTATRTSTCGWSRSDGRVVGLIQAYEESRPDVPARRHRHRAPPGRPRPRPRAGGDPRPRPPPVRRSWPSPDRHRPQRRERPRDPRLREGRASGASACSASTSGTRASAAGPTACCWTCCATS